MTHQFLLLKYKNLWYNEYINSRNNYNYLRNVWKLPLLIVISNRIYTISMMQNIFSIDKKKFNDSNESPSIEIYIYIIYTLSVATFFSSLSEDRALPEYRSRLVPSIWYIRYRYRNERGGGARWFYRRSTRPRTSWLN